MPSHVIIDDLPVSTLPLQETAALICRCAGSVAAQTVFTLNLDHVVKLRRDPGFGAAYRRAGLITADGFPIVLAGKLQGRHLSRVAGSDLIDPICAEAARTGKSVFLFGSSPDVLAATSRTLQERHSSLCIAGALSPPLGFAPTSQQANEAIEAIGRSGADLCFVALGAPKQELFADHAKQRLPTVSFVCIGAGLDFIAGTQRRAPELMQRYGLEWLWRAGTDPRRLLHRYVLCLAALPGLLVRSATRRPG